MIKINLFNNISYKMSSFFDAVFSDISLALIFLGILFGVYLVINATMPKPAKPRNPLDDINDSLNKIDSTLYSIKDSINKK